MGSSSSLFPSHEPDLPVVEHRLRRRSKVVTPIREAPNGDGNGQLTFSDFARPAIVLDPSPASDRSARSAPRTVELDWWPVPISARTLSGLTDGLIILASVLGFSLLLISSIHIFPSWPIASALAGVVGIIFSAVYWILFRWMAQATPGERLAELAWRREAEEREDDRPRFR